MSPAEIRSLKDRLSRLERDVARIPSRPSRGGSSGGSLRLVKITGASAIAERNNAWAYTVVDASARPDGTMVAVSGATPFTAYNPAEAFNDGADIEGNGVDRDNLPGSWAMVPLGVPSGAFVYRTIKCDDTGTPDGFTWWILQAPNHDDGPCE